MLRFLIIANTVVSAFAICLFLWFFAIEWSGHYQEKIVILDAVSVQLTILETMLAIGGIVLAIAGFWGYQKIKDYNTAAIENHVNKMLPGMVNEYLSGRGYKEKQELLTKSKNQMDDKFLDEHS